MKLLLRPLDIPVIALSAAIVALSALAVYGNRTGTAQVTVRGADASWVFPLDAEETLSVNGPAGETVIEIRDGAARVRSSSCENQSCVAAGWLHADGDWTACLPNRVFLIIENQAPGATDAHVW